MLCILLFSFSIGENKPLPACGGNKQMLKKETFSQALLDVTKHFWKAKAAGLVAWRTESSGDRETFLSLTSLKV